MLHSCWNVCKSNCYKSMKLGWAVPCTKTIKKIKRKNKSTAVHRRQGTIKPPWGLPIGWKIKAPKYSHIIYQSIANFLFFHMLKNEVFQIWPSFACKFDVLSEKYEKHMLKMNRKPPLEENSFNWYLCIRHCIDTVQYIWILLFWICGVWSSSFYIHT